MSISGLITKLKDCRPKVIISLILHITIILFPALILQHSNSTIYILTYYIGRCESLT